MGRAATWVDWKWDPAKKDEHVAMLTDTSECIGCKACEVACKHWNQNEARPAQEPGTYQSHPKLDAKTWTVVQFIESPETFADGNMGLWLLQKHNCMHCTEAGCVTACPTDALKYGDYGVVTLDQDACIGCAYCEQACPFDAIHVDRTAWGQKAQKAGKCTLCFDRISNGMQPACVKTCPTDCIKFGKREELIKWGQQRVAELKARGYKNAYLYGVNEVGGTHQLYILLDRPEKYGLPANPQVSPRVKLWRYVVQPLGKALLGTAVFGLVLNWLVARRTFRHGHGHEGHAAD